MPVLSSWAGVVVR